ncbi:MAG: phosphotransferase family protein [Lewinellaceae bacterium]|nr:phosphotransferase family protein [Phaeodactylibacter sp.]MCB9038646.1 phosphotransferase family protein [Lewinellaceae bacterium]
MLDQAAPVREGEELDQAKLSEYFRRHWKGFQEIKAIRQFPGGYSNLTYLLQTGRGEYVLRRPPFGANIKSAHDMGREYRVLSALDGIYEKIPRPVLYCEDETVIGVPFYIMERVQGVILRGGSFKKMGLEPDQMRAISEAAVDNLAGLHRIDIQATGLAGIGKPEGYIGRQVEGWAKRYYKAQTDTIPDMDELAEWMRANQPEEGPAGLIHNDYKYDNLVLQTDQLSHIRAVLDWEMATVGDPLMDLGTSLAYWTEPGEARLLPLAAANLTWLPGNLTRAEVVERYAAQSGRHVGDPLFYYVYGAFKIGVIVQQIYARYRKGHTRDERFANLIEAVRFFGQLGRRALDRGRISGLF